MVTYGGEEAGNVSGFLSFPWIVWDVLAFVKRQKMYGSMHYQLDPIVDRLNLMLDTTAKHFRSKPCRCPRIGPVSNFATRLPMSRHCLIPLLLLRGYC